MAIIICPECGKEISDTSKVCIHCGCNVKKKIKELNKKQKNCSEEEKKKRKKRKKILIGVLVFALLTGGTAVGVKWFFDTYTFAPMVVGMSDVECIRLLSDKSLNYEVVETNFTFDYEKNIVYEQNVAENQICKKGDIVQIKVSEGKKYIMPDVVGLSEEEAVEKLGEIPHIIEKKYTYDTEEGIVSAQSVNAGIETEDAKTIKIDVSKGIYQEVPDLKGMTKEDAKEKVEALGGTVKIVEKFSNKVKKGKVISYSPNYIGKGEIVEISVSKGEGIIIPNYKGMSLDRAIQSLKKKGIKYRVEYVYEDMLADCKEIEKEEVYSSNNQGEFAKNNLPTVTLKVNKQAMVLTNVDFEFNYVDGVDTYLTFKNISDKQIAYIDVVVEYYDTMGYHAECSIKDDYRYKLTYTGPLNAGRTSQRTYWDAVIYNASFGALKPTTSIITFTDGTKQTITHTGRYWYNDNFYGGELHD